MILLYDSTELLIRLFASCSVGFLCTHSIFVARHQSAPRRGLFTAAAPPPVMNNINANFDAVGQAFAQHYYNTFDSDRTQLGPLYNVRAPSPPSISKSSRATSLSSAISYHSKPVVLMCLLFSSERHRCRSCCHRAAPIN